MVSNPYLHSSASLSVSGEKLSVLLTQGPAYSSEFLFASFEMPENLVHRSCNGKLIRCHLVSVPAYPYHVPVPPSVGWERLCGAARDRNSRESCFGRERGWLPCL